MSAAGSALRRRAVRLADGAVRASGYSVSDMGDREALTRKLVLPDPLQVKTDRILHRCKTER